PRYEFRVQRKGCPFERGVRECEREDIAISGEVYELRGADPAYWARAARASRARYRRRSAQARHLLRRGRAIDSRRSRNFACTWSGAGKLGTDPYTVAVHQACGCPWKPASGAQCKNAALRPSMKRTRSSRTGSSIAALRNSRITRSNRSTLIRDTRTRPV